MSHTRSDKSEIIGPRQLLIHLSMRRRQLKKQKRILILAIIGCAVAILPDIAKKTRDRTIWVRNCLSERRQKGEYDLLLNQLRLEDAEGFRRYLRMNSAAFGKLMELVGPIITKKRTRMRELPR